MSPTWTVDQELAATGVEIAWETYRVLLAANGVKKARLPKPLSIPRPSSADASKPKRRQATSVNEVLAVLTAGHRRVGNG